jgi:hypothetical protein
VQKVIIILITIFSSYQQFLHIKEKLFQNLSGFSTVKFSNSLRTDRQTGLSRKSNHPVITFFMERNPNGGSAADLTKVSRIHLFTDLD